MSQIKVGVIGAGYWGPNLIRNFYQLDDAALLWVCDLKQERLDHVQSKYPGIQVTKNYRDLLNADIDAVVIATPVSTHHRLALECLRACKHVLIEKPLASNSQHALEIVEAGEAAGKLVMTGHTFLYNPAVKALKTIIASGEIGHVYYASGTRVNLGLYQPDINVVWDLAPHDISILLHILDLQPISSSARGGMYVKPNIHDVAYLTLHYPDGVMADLRLSWLDPSKIRRLTIVGSKKMIVYDDIEPVDKVKIFDKGVEIQPYTDTYEEFHLAYRYGDVTPYPLDWHEPLKLECQHFVDCIRSGVQPLTNGREGLKVVRVVEAAQRSLFNSGQKEMIQW